MILDFIFLTITYLGGFTVVLSVTVLAFLSFSFHRQNKTAARLLMAVAGSGLTVFLLKFIFDRPRPEGALYQESLSSFPSGHATLSMALYGFIFYTILKHEKHPLKNKTLLLLSSLIVLIGLSRLYLGVHHLSDVLIGYLIGLVWILIASKIKIK